MDIKPVKQERLYLKVADQIAEQIRAGKLNTGQRLPAERELASMFNVSRPTIREALIALEIAGQVEIRSGSGVYVLELTSKTPQLPPDAPGPLELIEARLYFESEAAAIAAMRAEPEDIARLETALNDMEAENLTEDLQEKADQMFHLVIAQATKNSAVLQAIERLWELRTTNEMSIFFHEKLRQQGSKPVIADHRNVLNAIRRKDADAARRAMQSHLQRVLDAVMDSE